MTPHPQATELADFVDGVADEATAARVAAHLRSCTFCAAIVEQARQVQVEGDEPDLGAFKQRVAGELLPQQWRRALVEQAVADPAAGQVWRLRTPDPFGDGPELTSVAVVVTAGDDLLVAPVTTDPQESTDPWTAQLVVADTNLLLAVWVSLAQPVGYEALDVYLGDVDASAVQVLHRALRRGQQPPAGLVLGGPVTPELREYREQLRSHLTLLGELRLTDLLAETLDEVTDVDVVDAIKAAGWGLRQLGEVADLLPGDARAVMHRGLALTETQRAAIEAALGVATRVVVALPAPGLVRAVATPWRRHRFEKVAEVRQSDLWLFRAEQVAQPVAARNNAGEAADWDALVEQRLMRLEVEAGLREP